jgi:predicted ATPase
VLTFEDLHWTDPTTLDVLRGLPKRCALAPLLIVATTRPEFRPPWGMRSHHATISLAPLDRAQVRDMIAELSARHALPREVVDNVTARTGGASRLTATIASSSLIQDASYENLLKSRRQVLHRRVAEILRDRFPDSAAAEPEVLEAMCTHTHTSRSSNGRYRSTHASM